MSSRPARSHLHHAPAWHAADAEREIERERAGRDDINLHMRRAVAEAHDRAVAVLLLDGGHGRLQIFVLERAGFAGGVLDFGFGVSFWRHDGVLLIDATTVYCKWIRQDEARFGRDESPRLASPRSLHS